MISLFESILQEASKERFIKPFYDNGIADKYKSIGIPTKEEMIKFYDTHSVPIDWNKKKDESFFEDLLFNMQNFTSKSAKKKDSNLLFKRDDCVVIDEDEYWIYVMPLTYSAAKFMDSFECGGDGAKWCIGWEQSDNYWNRYNEYSIFVLMFNKLGTKSEKNDLKYMVQFDCEENLKTPIPYIWDQPDSEVSEYLFSKDNKRFGRHKLQKIYEKALNIQMQLNPDKFYISDFGDFEFNSTQEMIETFNKYKPGIRPKKHLARYRSDYHTIDIKDGLNIQDLRFLYNKLREYKVDLSSLTVNCDVLTINENYDNDNFDRLDLQINQRVRLDTIAAKSINPIKLDIRGTSKKETPLLVKLPLNYALTHDVKKTVKSIFKGFNLANFKILAEVNKSVKESGQFIDGQLSTSIYVKPEEKNFYFYNCNLDVSALEVEDIKNLKTVNCRVIHY